MNNPRIIHIDTVKELRGGQRQVAYLLKELTSHHIFSLLVCQPNSALRSYCERNKLFSSQIYMKCELDVKAAYKISRLMKQHDANILHTHTGHALTIGLIAKLFHPHVRLVYTKRVAFPIRRNVFSKLKYKNSFLDKIICISHYIEHSFTTEGIDQYKLTTIPSGIMYPDTKKVIDTRKIRKEFSIPENDFVITTIAALENNKGYQSLLESAQIVLQHIKNICFVAIGKGRCETELKDKARQLGIDHKFHFLGFQEDPKAFLRISDLFVLASKQEGLGSSILDAQALRIPVIGANTGGIPEIIKHNKTGLLVPVDDSRALAEQIIYLYNNNELRKNLSQAALISVKNFSIKDTAEKYLDLYTELLSNKYTT